MSVEQFADGVLRVVNANMEKAVRVVSIERGYDPRNFSLLAFGGAGPLHGAVLAETLSIPEVIVPAMPGALSAYGILVSDVVRDFSRTVLLRSGTGGEHVDEVDTAFNELERHAGAGLLGEGWQEKPRFARSVDVRYRGQGYELNVPFSSKLLTEFHAEHQKRYGYSHPEREVELVTVRLRATIPSMVKVKGSVPSRKKARPEQQQVWFGGRKLNTAIWQRESLPARKIAGPAIVTEYSATTVVPPQWAVRVAITGDLVLSAEKSEN
jgi:N-methylhydantoinase A